jgi:hypothetical protein
LFFCEVATQEGEGEMHAGERRAGLVEDVGDEAALDGHEELDLRLSPSMRPVKAIWRLAAFTLIETWLPCRVPVSLAEPRGAWKVPLRLAPSCLICMNACLESPLASVQEICQTPAVTTSGVTSWVATFDAALVDKALRLRGNARCSFGDDITLHSRLVFQRRINTVKSTLYRSLRTLRLKTSFPVARRA